MPINGELTFPDVPGKINEHNQSPNAHSVRIDNTVSQSGMAADAKATRDLIENVSGQIEADVDALDDQVTDLKSALSRGRFGYAERHIMKHAGSGHSSKSDLLYFDVAAGDTFTVKQTGYSGATQIYAFFTDGTNDRLIMGSSYTGTSEKDIYAFGLYITATEIEADILLCAFLENSLYTLPDKVDYIKKEISDTRQTIHIAANAFDEKIYPEFEMGKIGSSGENISSISYCRTKDYLEKATVALLYIGARSGSLYCHRYTYANNEYTFVGRNQITSTGDMTSWLLGQAGTHFRLEWGGNPANVFDWLDLRYKTNLRKINAFDAMDLGRINKNGRELLVGILRAALYNTNKAQDIMFLNRYLIYPGELVVTQTAERITQSGGTANDQYTSITEYYPIEAGATHVVVYMAVDDMTQMSAGDPFVDYKNTENTHVNGWNMSNSGRQNVEYEMELRATYAYVGFTLFTDSIQKSYAYFRNSGNIIFAGSLSPYAGMKNINQKGGVY